MPEKTDHLLWDARRLACVHAERDKAHRVRRMFDAIAPTYERVNSLASLGRDRFWRNEMVRLAEVQAEDILLDMACGTGDVSRAFASAPVRPARILGLDFSLPMLQRAVSRPIDSTHWFQADALQPPLADSSVSLVTCAFGIRNFQNLEDGLKQMFRVLCEGGRAVLLEFSVPDASPFRKLYLFYFYKLMPVLARWISADRTGAYRYLPESVVSFDTSEAVILRLKAAGFSRVTAYPLTGGIVTVYVAWKSGDGRRTS